LRTDRRKRRQRRADQGAQPGKRSDLAARWCELGSGARYNINAIDIVKEIFERFAISLPVGILKTCPSWS